MRCGGTNAVDAEPGDAGPDTLASESLIATDGRKLGARKAGALQDRHERVTLMAISSLTPARHDAARRGVDRDLAAVHQVRPLPGLVPQPGSNLGITSIYLQGIDNAEIIDTVHVRRAPMIPVSPSQRL